METLTTGCAAVPIPSVPELSDATVNERAALLASCESADFCAAVSVSSCASAAPDPSPNVSH